MSAEERILLQRMEEENNLRKKLLGMNMNPMGMLPVTLPGEFDPRNVNFGEGVDVEYEELGKLPPDRFEDTGAWLLGKDGKFHLNVLLPGEKMGAAFGAHMREHAKEENSHHRMRSAMLTVTPNPTGGAPSMDFTPQIQKDYGTVNGPFKMNAYTTPNNGVVAVCGTRAANQLFQNSAALARTKMVFGCPIVMHETEGGEAPKKKIKLRATMDHIRRMKSSFNPMLYNHGDLEANPSMIYLKSPSEAMTSVEAADHLSRSIPNLSLDQATNIVAGIKNQYAMRFQGQFPSDAVFQSHPAEIYHPNATYVPPAGQFEHQDGGKNAQFALSDKQVHVFGSGFALRYGAPNHKNHVFQMVYTPNLPQGAPVMPPYSTSWYPHGQEEDAYYVQPSHAPHLPPQVAIGMPVGTQGYALLS